MADHWRTEQTSSSITREAMIFIIAACVGWIIGFGIGMVAS